MSSLPETPYPRITVVEEIDAVPVTLPVEQRIAFLADHLGMSRKEVAGKMLAMIFREDLDWEDLQHLRDLTEGVASPPES